MINYYLVLGLERTATAEQIKAAYKEYAKNFHPDIHRNSEFFKQRFQEIQQAYDTLSNVTKRQEFDKKLFDSTLNNQSEINNLNQVIIGLKSQIASEKVKYDKLYNELHKGKRVTEEEAIKLANLNIGFFSGNIGMLKNPRNVAILLGLLCLWMTFWVFLIALDNKHRQEGANNIIGDKNNLVNMHKIYERVVKYDGEKNYKKILLLSDSLFRNGEVLDSSDAATIADKLRLEKADYYLIRGYAKTMLNNDTGAVRDYTMCILRRKHPAAQPFMDRADVKRKLGDNTGALSDANRAVSIDTNNFYARVTRATIFYDMKQYDRALVDYETAIKIKPEEVYCLEFAGHSYKELGKNDSACVYWRKAGDLGSKTAFEQIAKFCK